MSVGDTDFSGPIGRGCLLPHPKASEKIEVVKLIKQAGSYSDGFHYCKFKKEFMGLFV